MVHEKWSLWRCQDLNSGPLGHESSALTTRPRLLAFNAPGMFWEMFHLVTLRLIILHITIIRLSDYILLLIIISGKGQQPAWEGGKIFNFVVGWH